MSKYKIVPEYNAALEKIVFIVQKRHCMLFVTIPFWFNVDFRDTRESANKLIELLEWAEV
jgi:hypothetical protein